MAKFLIWFLASLDLVAALPANAADPQSSCQAHHSDADLVTAIDVSGSIDGYAEWLELAGMADALERPALLRAIRGG